MTVHLVTFATQDMEQSSWLCTTSSKKHGVETHARFNPGNLLRNEAHRECWPVLRELFAQPRGCGYWAWKPLIISKELEWLPEGSTLIYSDAGVEFINNVNYIIDRMDQDIFLFGNNWEHAHWCKRDIVEAVCANSAGPHVWLNPAERCDWCPWCNFGKQCQASVIFFRVSDYTRKFVAEWLKWCLHRIRFSEGVCTDEWRYLIDDSPGIAPNHPEFRENRHDQAILTTLAYREGIKLHYWPSVYNRGGSPEFVYEKLPEYASDTYPVLFSHHRRRNHEFKEAV